MRIGIPIVLMTLLFTQGCQASTQLPVKIEDIRICTEPSDLTPEIRRISADMNLKFYYSTYPSDRGTKVAYRLIGGGYEIEFFNPFEEDEFSLRAYQMKPGDDYKANAENAYDRFKGELAGHMCGAG